MISKDIYIYVDAESWLEDKPCSVIKGAVTNRSDGYIEILDDKGYTQVLNLDKLFAVVY